MGKSGPRGGEGRNDSAKQGNNLRKLVAEVGGGGGETLRSFAATGSFVIKKQSIFAILRSHHKFA